MLFLKNFMNKKDTQDGSLLPWWEATIKKERKWDHISISAFGGRGRAKSSRDTLN